MRAGMGRGFRVSKKRPNHWHGMMLYLAGGLAATGGWVPSSPAQTPLAPSRLESHVDTVGSEARSSLEQMEQFLSTRQWDDAVEMMCRVIEQHGRELIPVTSSPGDPPGFARYARLDEYCHDRIAGWATSAPEALARYRSRVDPLARHAFEQGLKRRDPRLLQQVVDQFRMSSCGAETLRALGELHLAQGEYGPARWCWEQLNPGLRVGPALAKRTGVTASSPLWLALRRVDWTHDEAAVAAEVRAAMAAGNTRWAGDASQTAEALAWLAWTSLLEGNLDRARLESELLGRVFPEAQGRLAGSSGSLAARLESLLKDSAAWHAVRPPRNWPSFGGAPDRARVWPEALDVVHRVRFAVPLPRVETSHDVLVERMGSRPGEGTNGILAYHPVIDRGMVFVQDGRSIWHWDLASNAEQAQAALAGEFPAAVLFRADEVAPGAAPPQGSYQGVPRYTLTISDQHLYARMGTPWVGVGRNGLPSHGERSFLVGIDLTTEKLLFDRIYPPDDGWEFDGTPVSDGRRLFVTERNREGGQEQVRLACYDAETGQRHWQTTVGRGALYGGAPAVAAANQLVTLCDGMVYVNTNAGVVAAVRARDGQLQWSVQYPRAAFPSEHPDVSDRHVARELNPCVVQRGMVLVAPADSDRIFALDDATGICLWSTPPQTAVDAVNVLGVVGDRLLASGDSLYWLDLFTGRLTGYFPVLRPAEPELARARPRGEGRGVLTPHAVYWPAEHQIYVVDPHGPRLVGEPFELSTLGATGGNLVVGDGVVVLATADRLFVLDNPAAPRLAAQPRSD